MSSARLYAILGDIHSNLEALNTVLDDARKQGVEGFVCVGDVVGYNADPVACVEILRELECQVVRGNHDHYCSHDEPLDDFHPLAANVVDWTRRQLGPEQTAYLRSLPLKRHVAGFSVVHSTLDMPDKWGYVFDTLEADAHFNYQTTAVCFYGHTHVPMAFDKAGGGIARTSYHTLKVAVGHRYFINVGSVGQPRDGDPRTGYVLYDAHKREATLRRFPYDIATTQDKIHRAGLPDRVARRLEQGK